MLQPFLPEEKRLVSNSPPPFAKVLHFAWQSAPHKMRLSPSQFIWPVLLLLGVTLGPLLFTVWQGYVTAPLEISAVQAIAPTNKLQTALILIAANIVGTLVFSAAMGILVGYVATTRPCSDSCSASRCR